MNDELRKALEQTQIVLASAFNRIHVLPRVSDTELAKKIGLRLATNRKILDAQPNDDEYLDQAISTYNKVWNEWEGLDANNVEECRKAAMKAALNFVKSKSEI